MGPSDRCLPGSVAGPCGLVVCDARPGPLFLLTCGGKSCRIGPYLARWRFKNRHSSGDVRKTATHLKRCSGPSGRRARKCIKNRHSSRNSIVLDGRYVRGRGKPVTHSDPAPLQAALPLLSTKGRRRQMHCGGALAPFSTGALGYFPKIAPKRPLRLVFSSR